MNGIRVWAGAALTAATLALAAWPAAAQTRVSPWIGLYAPTQDLGSVQAIDLGKKGSTLAFGGDIDLNAASVLGLRLGAGYATDSEVDFDEQTCVACGLRATVLMASAAAVVRLPVPGIRPYALAGGGWRWYDFDFEGPISAQLSDQGSWIWVIGAGAQLNPDGALSLFAELLDHTSELEFDDDSSGNTQHDLVLKIGVGFRIGGGDG